MSKKASRLIEGFVKGDLVRQIIPNISIDEYSAKVGEDADIVTLTFSTRTKVVGEDLAEWFDRGYDWVMDAEVSEGELKKNHYLVFVEVERRSTVADRIVEMVEDLVTLTELPANVWTATIDGHDYPLDPEILSKLIPQSPHQYRIEHPEEETEDDATEEAPEEEAAPEQAPAPEGDLPPPPAPGQVDPNAMPPAPAPTAPVPGQPPAYPQAPAPAPTAPVPGQPPAAPAAPAAPQAPAAPMFENALDAYRNLAGLPTKVNNTKADATLRDFLNRAGL